ncbi:MAG: hypothetical protein EA342_15910 [Leptolyngbya sp. LCM1.Bin17]|nr:MAG: hypothetical protein EA342_15910 [Leptolyngbya sp. LCM1.Bin17]
MQTSELQWTSQEQAIVKTAVAQAHQREITTLVQVVRDQAQAIACMDDLWQLHDFLSARRHDLDGKYDQREPTLMFMLAGLIKDGWLSLDELTGLADSKLAKIKALAQML